MLAKAVFDLVIAGDDEPVPVAERPALVPIPLYTLSADTPACLATGADLRIMHRSSTEHRGIAWPLTGPGSRGAKGIGAALATATFSAAALYVFLLHAGFID